MSAIEIRHIVWEDSMTLQRSWPVDRRTLLKTSAAVAAVQLTSPFIIQARGETPVRIGMVDPLTGVYAAIAQGEVVGAKFAAEEINKKGGILGRPVELLVEDSANDVGTGVQKTRKLIERDQVSFIVGDVNSGIAIAMAQVTSEKKVLHIVSGGHSARWRARRMVDDGMVVGSAGRAACRGIQCLDQENYRRRGHGAQLVRLCVDP